MGTRSVKDKTENRVQTVWGRFLKGGGGKGATLADGKSRKKKSHRTTGKEDGTFSQTIKRTEKVSALSTRKKEVPALLDKESATGGKLLGPRGREDGGRKVREFEAGAVQVVVRKTRRGGEVSSVFYGGGQGRGSRILARKEKNDRKRIRNRGYGFPK